MKTVSADFNAMTESEQVRLNFPRSRADIEEQHLGPGDWAWLSDGEVIVGARLVADHRFGLVGVPDWDTVIHLDDPDAENFVRVGLEMRDGMQEGNRSAADEGRILELMAQFEHYAPSQFLALSSGDFSLRRALGLQKMGKLGLALLEAREARAALPDDPNVAFLYLDLLRRQDLSAAVKEAESMAASSSASADLLSGCINVLASRAEEVEGVEFESLSSRILTWCDRLEHAPDRADAEPSLLALADFNRGLVLLRLGRKAEASKALRRAEATFPAGLRVFDLGSLQSYDDRAREVAKKIRGIVPSFPHRPVAA